MTQLKYRIRYEVFKTTTDKTDEVDKGDHGIASIQCGILATTALLFDTTVVWCVLCLEILT